MLTSSPGRFFREETNKQTSTTSSPSTIGRIIRTSERSRMPPPLRCHSITPSTSCANQLRKAAQSRPFSSTPQREIRIRTTRARRQMFTWLHTQGKAFLNPLPGSTNYLSAYDSSGKLTRLPDDKTVKNTKSAPDSQRSSRREGGSVLPREGLFDLRPFPLNTQFQSPRVLSEELREAIWEKIMKNGQSVRDVSAFLGVEMRRVAAVVRLKEVEKEWQRIVSPPRFLLVRRSHFYDDLKKNRLVFKTTTWLQNLACEPL